MLKGDADALQHAIRKITASKTAIFLVLQACLKHRAPQGPAQPQAPLDPGLARLIEAKELGMVTEQEYEDQRAEIAQSNAATRAGLLPA
mgnify:CR=1 FL=1